MDRMTAPKAFISYSWTSPEHQQWVLDLATQLRESGVVVVFDIAGRSGFGGELCAGYEVAGSEAFGVGGDDSAGVGSAVV